MIFRLIRSKLPLLALFGLGYLLARRRGAEFGSGNTRNTGAQDGILRSGRSPGRVRPAGPETMRNPPRDWDNLDEAIDESFPASDSAAKY